MMISCTRRLDFDFGHRVLLHESKCATCHGHRGTVEITCEAPELDKLGRVIDFGKIKEVVGGWIDANWDHTMILNSEDPLVVAFQRDIQRRISANEGMPRPLYILFRKNPTAENLAQELFRVASGLLHPLGIAVTHIRFYETPNGWADASLGHAVTLENK